PLVGALEAAHETGVVHRDLKPDNVFLVETRGGDPVVKLLDFGLAKLVRDDARSNRTVSGVMMGTPRYMPPEQAIGQAVDRRADIYALGAMAFELFTRRSVFLAPTDVAMAAAHLYETAPRMSSLTPVPPALDDLVLAMLAKDPANRPSLDD